MPNEEAIQKMSIVDPIQVNVNIPNFEGKPGRDGTDGRDGDDAYRIAVRNGFLGTEKEWLLTLKGQDGKSASAPTARQTLLQNNVWCEDDTVDSVFTAIIGNWGKPMPRTEFKPMRTQSNVIVGNPVVMLTGEPHFKARIDGSDNEFDTNGNTSVTVPSANTGDSYTIEYIGFTNNKVSSLSISFGDLSSIFKKGNLIETKEFDMSTPTKVIASIYDNKVLELTTNGDKAYAPTVDGQRMQPIKDWALTKVDDIATLIVNDALTLSVWNPYNMSIFDEWSKTFGHGLNVKIDFAYLKERGYANSSGMERIFNSVQPSDRHSKDYIGKAIQVGNSNVMILKPTSQNIVYLYDSASIVTSYDYL